MGLFDVVFFAQEIDHMISYICLLASRKAGPSSRKNSAPCIVSRLMVEKQQTLQWTNNIPRIRPLNNGNGVIVHLASISSDWCIKVCGS